VDGSSIGPGLYQLFLLHRASSLSDLAADELRDLLPELVRSLERALPEREIELTERDLRELAQRLVVALGPSSRVDGPRVAAPLAQAETAAQDLLDAERPDVLVHGDRRFTSPLPARLLIRRARSAGPENPREALRMADLAVCVARRVDAGVWGVEAATAVRCQAGAARVEALLYVGELSTAASEAKELLAEADERIGARMRGDLYLIAAHVARRSGESEEAAGLLMVARELYEAIGDGSRLGRSLLQLGEVYREHGQVDLAVDAARRAVGFFEDGGDREAERCARHNLAIYLCDAGRPGEAWVELRRSRELLGKEAEESVLLSSLWIEARIREDFGDLSTAEGLYRRVRKELLELGAVTEAVQVGLDLVGLWIEIECYAEAVRGARWLEVLLGKEPELAQVRVELVILRDGIAEGEAPGKLLRRLGRIRRLLPGR
jgi:tetratricopeptide (TPR) repeat protein